MEQAFLNLLDRIKVPEPYHCWDWLKLPDVAMRR